jgi:3-phenylpropionate/trans-cinnamate dioxygenase ferredoxin subunit
MDESGWVIAIEEDKLRENSVELVSPNGIGLLLIRKAGNEIYAVSNKCAHMACPLRRGVLDGYILKCPCHDWRFDIRTGELLEAREIKIRVYEWKVIEGNICVKL